MRHIIAYDIGDNGRRYRVATALMYHGVRIQRSVFECDLEPDELATLMAKVDQLIDSGEDVVHAFRLCDRCSSERHTLGAVIDDLAAAYYVV